MARVQQLRGPGAPLSVLEVGFGNGMLLEHFLRAGAATVAGIDWSPVALETARLRLLSTGHGHAAHLRCADICSLPADRGGGGSSGGDGGGVDLVAALDSANCTW